MAETKEDGNMILLFLLYPLSPLSTTAVHIPVPAAKQTQSEGTYSSFHVISRLKFRCDIKECLQRRHCYSLLTRDNGLCCDAVSSVVNDHCAQCEQTFRVKVKVSLHSLQVVALECKNQATFHCFGLLFQEYKKSAFIMWSPELYNIHFTLASKHIQTQC